MILQMLLFLLIFGLTASGVLCNVITDILLGRHIRPFLRGLPPPPPPPPLPPLSKTSFSTESRAWRWIDANMSDVGLIAGRFDNICRCAGCNNGKSVIGVLLPSGKCQLCIYKSEKPLNLEGHFQVLTQIPGHYLRWRREHPDDWLAPFRKVTGSAFGSNLHQFIVRKRAPTSTKTQPWYGYASPGRDLNNLVYSFCVNEAMEPLKQAEEEGFKVEVLVVGEPQLYWIPISGKKAFLVKSKVRGGYEEDGEPLYVCRYSNVVKYGVVVGKYSPSLGLCIFTYNGYTYKYPSFEILINPEKLQLTWTLDYFGHVPEGAVTGGWEKGANLYIGRTAHRRSLQIGKIEGLQARGLVYTYQFVGQKSAKYEVLVEVASGVKWISTRKPDTATTTTSSSCNSRTPKKTPKPTKCIPDPSNPFKCL